MRAVQSSRQRQTRNPDSRTATGFPPVPPEDSPKAVAGEVTGASLTSGRLDVRQSVTDRIIAMLDKGGNAYRQRWTRAAARGMPRNGKTGAPYHGANVLLLWDAAIEQGYSSNVWLTYKQAAGLGAQVRKGERAVLCAHFERKVGKPTPGTPGTLEPASGLAQEEGADHGAGGRSALVCLPFWLFNVAQIDGLPVELIDAHCYPVPAPYSPGEMAMRIVAGSHAQIRYGFEQALYVVALDEIRMPWPRRFTSAEAHSATVLHELVHWSGHPGRLHRAYGERFGDESYAFEELVAELGSAFLLGHCGLVDATIEGHAAYLDSWLKVLRNDRTAIFTAARLAGQACEFLLSLALPDVQDASTSHETP
jgi:antirestriction protein ArdC